MTMTTPDVATAKPAETGNKAETPPQPSIPAPPSPMDVGGGGPPIPSAPPPPPAPKEPPSSVVETPRQHGGPRKGAGRPRNTTPAGTKDAPPPPFMGGPPTGEAAGQTPSTLQQLVAAPEGIVDIAQIALDGAVLAVATWRYGEEEAKSVQATAEAKAEIRKALSQYVRLAGLQMTPGQAVASAIFAAYAPKIIENELSGKAKRKPKAV